MVRKRKEVAGFAGTPQWKCLESRVDNKRLYYGRFVLSPLREGQADTIGLAMRRTLLGEIEGTCITRVKSKNLSDNVFHEYSQIVGIEEPVHEILINLKGIVLRSNLNGVRSASICVRGPQYITAKDIISPPSVEIVDTTQPIATLTEPIDFCIELQIKRDRGYPTEITKMECPNDGSYLIEPVFMPVQNVNYSIHSYGNGNEEEEILFLEIWTNGSLTPKEALYEASRNLIDLLIPFLHAEKEGINSQEKENRFHLLPFSFQDRFLKKGKNRKGISLKCIFIDQSELPSRIYNSLKKSNIHTLWDLLNHSQEDLMKLENFRLDDVKQILDTLRKQLPNY